MAKCEDKSLKITVKKASATGMTKDSAELALALKIISEVEKTRHFKCDGACDEGDCEPKLHFQGPVQFDPTKIKTKPPAKAGFIIGWKCTYTGKATIFCECSESPVEIENDG